MDKISIATSNALKLYRKEKGWTQAELAENLDNRSVKTIAQWEQCKASVPIDVLVKVRNELGISLDEIYGLEPIENVMPSEKLLNKWIEEYSNDESNAFYGEIDDIDYSEIDNSKSFNSAEISQFLGCFFDLPIELQNERFVLKRDANIEENVIRFFLRKKQISSFVTFDEEKQRFRNDNFYVSFCLVKILIENYINSLKVSVLTEERIKNMVSEKISLEVAKDLAKKQNEKIIEQIKSAEKLLEIAKGMDK